MALPDDDRDERTGIEDDADGDVMEIDLNDPGDDDVEENEDGSATLTIDPGTTEPADGDFYANLADNVLDQGEVTRLGLELFDFTDRDKEAHTKRIEAYADALKRSGLDGNPTGGADFEGASKAVHPMLQEAAVDFMSSAIRELMPLGGEESGPVKHQTIGKATQKKVDKAYRKSCLMNWQLTKQMPSFRDTLEELLTQLPFAGRQYLKLYQNRVKNRPEELFVPTDEVWLPAGVSSFAAAKRYTHAQTLDRLEMQARIDAGMYLPLAIETAAAPETTAAQDATDAIAGKDRDAQNEDGDRIVREVYAFLTIESDPMTQGKLAPYIVSIDDESQQVLSIYRDWYPQDPNREQLIHLVEWGFIPWRGGPIGLAQLIGGLSIAATGALRALLDSAHMSNLQGAVALKGGTGKGGQNIEVAPGKITQIDAPVGVDDIRKAIMTMPFPQPSNVLFELLGFLVEAGRGVVNVALEKMAESKPDMPVGTTLALIEQGSKVYAAIHARLHRAMERTLTGLHQLNRAFLDEEMLAREAGEVLAKREDFEGAVDVAPVSDPNIFSEAQRFAQIQAVAARATGNPLYDARKVEETILKRLKIPDATDLLVPKPEPKKLNPVNENLAAAQGQPIIAFPDQDHMAHLRTHIEFLMNPMFGQNPLLQPVLVAPMLQHIKDHMVLAYVASIVEATDKASGISTAQLMDDDDEVSKHMDDMLSDASTIFLDSAVEFFDQVMPPPEPQPMPGAPPKPQSQLLAMLAQMQQLVQQFAPPQPMDPAQVASQDVQRKSQADQQSAQIEQQKVQNDAQKVELLKQQALNEAQQTQIEGMREERLQQAKLQTDTQIHASDNVVKERMNTADNLTALTIAQGEMESGERVALSTGTGINPGT